MDKIKLTLISVAGLITGAGITYVIIHEYFITVPAYVSTRTENAHLAGITSVPIRHPLGQGEKIDLTLSIVNASEEDALEKEAENDLSNAGFSVVSVSRTTNRPEVSTLRYKRDKQPNVDLLLEWLTDDYGKLVAEPTLPENKTYDAELTIGTFN